MTAQFDHIDRVGSVRGHDISNHEDINLDELLSGLAEKHVRRAAEKLHEDGPRELTDSALDVRQVRPTGFLTGQSQVTGAVPVQVAYARRERIRLYITNLMGTVNSGLTSQNLATNTVITTAQPVVTWDLAPLDPAIIASLGIGIIVSAVSGTTPNMQLAIDGSQDGTNWYFITSSGNFTAAANSHLSVGGPLPRYIRLRATNVTGTTPSFTVSLYGDVNYSGAAPLISAPVFLGATQATAQPTSGHALPPGKSITLETMSDVWASVASGTGPVTVTVLDEYRSESDGA